MSWCALVRLQQRLKLLVLVVIVENGGVHAHQHCCIAWGNVCSGSKPMQAFVYALCCDVLVALQALFVCYVDPRLKYQPAASLHAQVP
jgi:hypothetical protein